MKYLVLISMKIKIFNMCAPVNEITRYNSLLDIYSYDIDKKRHFYCPDIIPSSINSKGLRTSFKKLTETIMGSSDTCLKASPESFEV